MTPEELKKFQSIVSEVQGESAPTTVAAPSTGSADMDKFMSIVQGVQEENPLSSIEAKPMSWAERTTTAPARVKTLQAERPDMLTSVKKELDYNPWGRKDIGTLQKIRDTMLKEPTLALKGVGMLGQRLEAAIANPVTGAQEGDANVINAAKRAWDGLSGKSKAEYGDVFREAGAPEWAAATGGLLTSFLNPETALGKGAISAATGIARNINRVKMLKGGIGEAYELIDKIPKAQTDYLFKTGFRAIREDVLQHPKETAQKVAYSIHNAVEEMRKKASSLFDNLKEPPPQGDRLISRNVAKNISDRLDSEVFDQAETFDAVVLEDVRNKAARIQRVETVNPATGKATTERFTTTVGNLLDDIAAGAELPMSQYVQLLKALKKSSRNSPMVTDMIKVISDSAKDAIPEWRQASDTWKVYSDANRARYHLIGDVSRKDYMLNDRAYEKIANYWELPTNSPYAQAADNLDSAINRFTAQYGQQLKMRPLADTIKDTAAAYKFAGMRPNLTIASLGGIAMIALRKMGVPDAAVGTMLASIIYMSSPKAGITTLKAAYRTSKRIENVMNKPLSKAASRVAAIAASQAAGEGLGRQITGRNDRPEGDLESQMSVLNGF
jgi:hypothetical protein